MNLYKRTVYQLADNKWAYAVVDKENTRSVWGVFLRRAGARKLVRNNKHFKIVRIALSHVCGALKETK